MRYLSTRGEADALAFDDCLLAGLARDGGLYVPEAWPHFGADDIAALAGLPFYALAERVIAPFVGAALPPAVLADACHSAYADFGHPAVTPLVQLGPNRFVLELFHGPTLAFKDVAMRLLARLLDHVLATRGQRATIVGATSGDTGGAAVAAFRGAKTADVFILFPHGRVSDVQRRMMTVPTEANVHALALDGTFDDAQTLVKGLFNHHAFRDAVGLTGVNSINWARIVAQVTYYFAAAVALGAPHRAIRFVVPTGNFGDIFAGYVAKRMGLPIERLVIATNTNDILARTLQTGHYEVRQVTATSSPSMDIQVSSNFERLLFEATGRDADAVRAMMGALAQSGRFTVPERARPVIAADFAACRAGEDEVAAVIRKTLARTGYLLDPHTATGMVAADQTAASAATPVVILATAHPAKFPDAMVAITGERPALPFRLADLLDAPERMTAISKDQGALERLIEARRPVKALV